MTNKELYNMFKARFEDIVLGYWQNFPYTAYTKEELVKGLTEIVETLNETTYTKEQTILSQRQSYLALDVIRKCDLSTEALYGDTIHQLADCIDNFREEERPISENEYILYCSLIRLVIKTVQTCRS